MNKLEYDLKVGKIYANTPRFKSVLESAHYSIKRFLSDYTNHPYLALSWGKQSIVLAHMIFHIDKSVPMYFMSSWESDLLHNYPEIERNFTQRWPINYERVVKDNVSWNNYSWKETRDIGSKDLQTFIEEVYPQWDGVIMGLSKDESVARRITLSKATTPYRTIFQYTNGKHRNCPIQHWRANDLAAYIATYDIPLLAAYHQHGLKARTTARITRNNAELNGLADLKRRDMTSYNKIVKRFPELTVYS